MAGTRDRGRLPRVSGHPSYQAVRHFGQAVGGWHRQARSHQSAMAMLDLARLPFVKVWVRIRTFGQDLQGQRCHKFLGRLVMAT